MERMQKMFEDFGEEVKKMGANDERTNALCDGLADTLFFSLTGMATSSEEMKKNIVKDARQKAVLYLRAIKKAGVDKFNPEKPKWDDKSDEMFESFSDVSWGLDDDDEEDEDLDFLGMDENGRPMFGKSKSSNDDDADDDEEDDDDFDDDDDYDEEEDDDYDTDDALEEILADFEAELKIMKVETNLIKELRRILADSILEPLQSLEAAPASVRGKYINGIRQGVVFYLRAVKVHGAKNFIDDRNFAPEDESEFDSFSDVEW